MTEKYNYDPKYEDTNRSRLRLTNTIGVCFEYSQISVGSNIGTGHPTYRNEEYLDQLLNDGYLQNKQHTRNKIFLDNTKTDFTLTYEIVYNITRKSLDILLNESRITQKQYLNSLTQLDNLGLSIKEVITQ